MNPKKSKGHTSSPSRLKHTNSSFDSQLKKSAKNWLYAYGDAPDAGFFAKWCNTTVQCRTIQWHVQRRNTVESEKKKIKVNVNIFSSLSYRNFLRRNTRGDMTMRWRESISQKATLSAASLSREIAVHSLSTHKTERRLERKFLIPSHIWRKFFKCRTRKK